MLHTKLLNWYLRANCVCGPWKYQDFCWSEIANILCALLARIIALIFFQGNTTEVDDVCAALALMYGYAASYAPSTAIEARIETLVVSLYLVNMKGLNSGQ